MSIMTSLRRAFGFSPENEEDEGEYDPSVPTYTVSTPMTTVSTTPTSTSAVASATHEGGSKTDGDSAAGSKSGEEIDATLTDDLFDAVIELFNRTQPEFVRECLNTDAQRKFILNSLSENLRQRVNAALTVGNSHWEKEKEALEKKIAALEGDDNEIARLRNENNKLRLSVDRQKRALLDRINDLESQVSKHAQERDNFYNRKHNPGSEQLANLTARIREIQTESEEAKKRSEELAAKNEALEAKIKELEEAAAETAPAISEQQDESQSQTPQTLVDNDNIDVQPTEIAEMKAKIEELETLKSAVEQEKAAAEEKCARLADELVKAQEEITRQTTLKEQLEVKTSMSDTMINDLRNQAASARQELESFQQEQESSFMQIQQQLSEFEELKARKDAKIAELKETNASLRQTVEANLYNQANSEMKLRSEIKDLKAEIEKLTQQLNSDERNVTMNVLGEPTMKLEERPATKRRGRPKKIRIDSELDNTDWFAGGNSSKHGGDPDFGYHEPPRRPVNDNEAQLTLF